MVACDGWMGELVLVEDVVEVVVLTMTAVVVHMQAAISPLTHTCRRMAPMS